MATGPHGEGESSMTVATQSDPPIYLDHNATTPVDPRVLAQLLPFLSTEFGNPSSAHSYGAAARQAVDRARRQVANLVRAQPDELTFTGSGTESNALAIRGVALAHQTNLRRTVVTTATEHPSVLNTCRSLCRLHALRLVVLPVDRTGRVDLDQAGSAIDDSVVLITAQLANGETGTIQPIAELTRLAHEHGAIIHTDAAQAAGKIPVDVAELDVDLATIAGHKLYAPKGIGALYHRRGLRLEPLLHGGGQEAGMRSGTENVPYVVALGAAAAIARQNVYSEMERIRTLRDRLHERLQHGVSREVRLNGHPTERLPNTLNVSIDGLDARAALADTVRVAASTTSACHAGNAQPSEVLLAMGLSEARAFAAMRLSLGRRTTPDDISAAVDALCETIDSGTCVT
jgi:cysteine desulfurase